MVQRIARLLLRLLSRLEIHGEMPRALPARTIVIANHQSFLDPVVIGSLLRFRFTWVVHAQVMQKWLFRQILKLQDFLVVDTSRPFALKGVIQAVEQGRPVVLFPEGRITTTGSLMKVYDGLAFVAAHTGATLLPVIIDGMHHSYFGRMKPPFPRRLRPRVRVTFFPLESLPEFPGATLRQRRKAASRHVRRRLEELWAAAQPRRTLFGAFLDAVSLYGRSAPVLEDIRFTPQSYGEVLRGALALARLTRRLSAESELLGVLMPNAAPTAMLLLGLLAARRVPAMLNYASGVEGMQNACVAANLKTVITSRAFLERAKLTDKVERLQGVRLVFLEDLRPHFTLWDKLWLMGWALRFPRRAFAPGQPHDPAVVLFTSGSEGRPKGVVLSHAAILANVHQALAVFEFSNKERFMTVLPLFHAFGLTTGLFLPLLTGAYVFLYPSPLHYRLIPELVYDRDCSILLGTPTFLAHYARAADPYDFYRIKYVIAGAEKLSDETRQVWADKFGIRLLEGYGATEMGPVISVNTPFFHKAGTVGRFLPGIEWRVEPVPGMEEGGMLYVRGPNQMLGYLRYDHPGMLEKPASALGADWYETGDIVQVDEEGYLRIIGRKKRFAKVAGEMVSLEAAELLAAAASPGKAHAALALADPKRGEMIVLYTEDPSLTRDQLLAAARRAGYPEVALPRQIVFQAKLPRLGSGKFDYVALQQRGEPC